MPNLAPYRFQEWSDVIVVSASTGPTSPSALRSDLNIYASWAAWNTGKGDILSNVVVHLFLDGQLVKEVVAPDLKAGHHRRWWDFPLAAKVKPGAHKITLVVDPANLIAESDESDNVYEKTITVEAAPTPTPTPVPPTPLALPPTPAPSGTRITDGQDATIPCATGAARVDATVSGIRAGLNGLLIGDSATITATAPDGSWLRWVFGGQGSLTIDGCTAVYSVTNIGAAYQTSATISISRFAPPTPTPTPTQTPAPCPPGFFGCSNAVPPAGRADATATAPAGEGGPTFYRIDKTLTIKVYDPANNPQGACTLPGIAMSINSVPTTDAVVWWVMTPRTAPFFVAYRGRNATVIDGDGRYTIELWVNGGLREVIRQHATCPVAVIRR